VSIAIQMATSLLDLLGVLLIGLVGALAVTTVQSQPPPETVTRVAEILGLSALSSQDLVLALAVAAATVLLVKSVVSSYLTRRVFIFLANRQALVSARLARELLTRPLTFIQTRSSQEVAFALIGGAGAATMSILGLLVIAATEIALLLVLGSALLILSPWVALGSVAFFALVAMTLQKAMGGWASRVGSAGATADIGSLNAIQEALAAYREVTVSNRRSFYVDRIQQLRWEAARVTADIQFIGMLPKYMFEGALVIGGVALAAMLFSTQDSVAAVGTLALFLAAASRVMPSLLRLQSATLGLRHAAGMAQPTYQLADDLDNPQKSPGSMPNPSEIRDLVRGGHSDFTARVDIDNVSLSYPGADRAALDGVTLHASAGQSIGLVGASGAGKSTLADVILGVLEPNTGEACLNGVPSASAVERWPGAIAYVPQHVTLANASIRSNVALGLPDEAIDDELVWEALDRAHLAEHVASLPDGALTEIGENGVRLSGGQRQRLGIARALYTRPHLLVLDEATSALDAGTEDAITQMIADLEGDVTTVVIAHRLSTVRDVDLLVYMEDGRVIATGPFEGVRSSVPALARQAELMGMSSPSLGE
jgi:ABC-type multidrug transport system fused ATPase/permease subunit